MEAENTEETEKLDSTTTIPSSISVDDDDALSSSISFPRAVSPDICDISASSTSANNVEKVVSEFPEPEPNVNISNTVSVVNDEIKHSTNQSTASDAVTNVPRKRSRGRPKKKVASLSAELVPSESVDKPTIVGSKYEVKSLEQEESSNSTSSDASQQIVTTSSLSASLPTPVETETSTSSSDVHGSSTFTLSSSSIFDVKKEDKLDSGFIPGLDLFSTDTSEINEKVSLEMSGMILDKVFPKNQEKDEKIKTLKVQSLPSSKSSSLDENTKNKESAENDNDADGDNSKRRRSSRLKSLEVQRGPRKRREVVFNSLESSTSCLGRTASFLSEDDIPFLTSSTSTPDLSTNPDISGSTENFATSLLSLASSLESGIGSSSNLPGKPLKVKDRWRFSSDVELRKSSETDSGAPTPDLSFMSISESVESIDVPVTQKIKKLPLTEHHKRQTGHLVFDSRDNELCEKLKKFEGLEDNLYRTMRKISKESRGMVCDCFVTKEEVARGEVGCNEHCLNRLLMVECGSRCPTGEFCTNKAFQNKEYCALEVFDTEKKGHGLRTMQSLPAGGFVIEYVGEVIDPWEFEKRTKEYAKGNQEHFYFMALKSDVIIDATMKGNCSRFINHSCEPNCETQKWTVNGELRIGFFAIRDLEPGDEITFDYQFERYGKKAQRCFCMTPSCRGWIGGDEEDEMEVDDDQDVDEKGLPSKSKPRSKTTKKKRKEVQLEDIGMEEELTKLERTGLKNRNHTLTLSRLMVRAEDWETRERLLQMLIEGDTPCKRLFLDYHGLRLLWSWMVDLPLPSADTNGVQLIKNDHYHKLFLKALGSLPIPNKTMLQDSKVLPLIEKWSFSPEVTEYKFRVLQKVEKPKPIVDPELVPTETLPSDQETKELPKEEMNETDVKVEPEAVEDNNDLKVEKMDVNVIVEPKIDAEVEVPTIEKQENIVETAVIAIEEIEIEHCETSVWEFVSTAKSLLTFWADLKEVFRIPKKERVEQMKEHEREADKGSSESLINYGYDRQRRKENRISKAAERKVPVLDSSVGHHVQSSSFQRHPRGPGRYLSKEQRRLMFAAQVAREEEEEKLRKQQDEMVLMHQERCKSLGLDYSTTPIVDPSGNYYLDPQTISWKEIDTEDPTLPQELLLLVQATRYPSQPPPVDVVETLTPEPEFVFPPWPEGLPPPPPLPPAVLPSGWKMTVDDEGKCYYYHVKTRHCQWYPPSPQSSEGYVSDSSDSSESDEEVSEKDGNTESTQVSPPVSIVTLRQKLRDRAEKRKKAGLVEEHIISPRTEEEKPALSQKAIRARKQKLMESKKQRMKSDGIELPRKKVKDEHHKTKDDSGTEMESLSPSVDSEALPVLKRRKKDVVDSFDSPTVVSSTNTTHGESLEEPLKISPMTTSSDPVVELVEHVVNNVPDTLTSTEPLIPGLDGELPTSAEATTSSTSRKRSSKHLDKKQRAHSHKKGKHGSSSSSSKSSGNVVPATVVISGSSKFKDKEQAKEFFRNQIASIVVAHLNPYRKPECLQGRITCTEDFKHLARKMTHAIVLKELKHTRDAKSLEVTDSVKHKTKEYIKKFMARFSSGNYARSPEDPQAK